MKKIDHVAIMVPNLEAALPFWSDVMGFSVSHIETVETEGVKVAMLPVGESKVELMEPTGEDTPVGKRIKQVGPGIHHVTFGVDDIRTALKRIHEAGITVIGESPRIGAGGSLVAFLHPKDTGGVLIELVERPTSNKAQQKPLQEGCPVLIYLKDPSEKLWGVLHSKDVSGITASAIDISSFDNWISQLERNEEDVVGPAMLFFPMHRVERILLDEGSGGLESLADRFKRRLGKTVHDYVG